MRVLPIILVLVVALAWAPASSAGAPTSVEIAFLRDGRLARVERVVPSGVAAELHALRQLTRGPTREERAAGLRTAFGAGVSVRSVRADGDTLLVSFSRSVLGPATAATVQARLTQVAATLGRLGAHRFVSIAAEGRLVTTLALGVRPPSWRPVAAEQGYLYMVRGIQLRLWSLGYLDRAAVTGSLDAETTHALLAFQGWQGISRTGTITGETQVELLRATRPRPSRRAEGLRLEIYRDRGVLLVARGNEAVRAVHTSTGFSGRTPAGAFRVYRKERLSWSVPFGVWMPYAAYFTGGIATHEYPVVPSYPASHGCVRLPAGEAERVYRLVDVGTPVLVF